MKLKARFFVASIIAILIIVIAGDKIGVAGRIGIVLVCEWIAFVSRLIWY